MSRPVVVTNPPRAERGLVDALGGYGVATLHEAQGRTGLLGSHLSPIQSGARISGSAVTVTVFELIDSALDDTSPADDSSTPQFTGLT